MDFLLPALDIYESFKTPKVELRLQHITQEEEPLTAVGGFIELNSVEFNHFSTQIRLSTSQKIGFMSDIESEAREDFFTPEGHAFSILNLANVQYQTDNFEARIGRIKLQTPFADPDDYRMMINTFEGFWTSFSQPTYTISLFGANKQSGYDAPIPSTFSTFENDSDGFIAWRASYHPSEAHAFTYWDYHADNIAQFQYFTYAFEEEFDNIEIESTIEYANIKEYAGSGLDGKLYGIVLETEFDEKYIAGLVIEKAIVGETTSISDGFGDGPFETSMDEYSIGEVSEDFPGNDINAYAIRGGLNYDLLGVEYVYGNFALKQADKTITEHNLYLSYSLNEQCELLTILTHLNALDENEKRLFARVDYRF